MIQKIMMDITVENAEVEDEEVQRKGVRVEEEENVQRKDVEEEDNYYLK